MIKNLALSTLSALALCAAATASNFSVSGLGGSIPDALILGTTWNVDPATTPTGIFTSTVAVANPVTSITKVTFTGLNHTFRGDLHMFLTTPAGVRHNIVVRPGFTGAGYGNGFDYLVGNYEIVPAGGADLNQQININGAQYTQYLNTGAGMWTSGTYLIGNTAMGSITGPSGTWTLTIVDWAAQDIGSLASWTLEGTDSASAGTPFCEPGVGGVMACACGNPNGAGVGCSNTGSSGASLATAGVASLASDSVDPGSMTLIGTNMLSGSSAIWLQGDALLAAGTTFGAGIRCAGGSLKRLYVKSLVGLGGMKTAPEAGDRSISNRSADLLDVIISGSTRWYQVYYRDPGLANPGGGCPAVATFNVTTGQAVTWAP